MPAQTVAQTSGKATAQRKKNHFHCAVLRGSCRDRKYPSDRPTIITKAGLWLGLFVFLLHYAHFFCMTNVPDDAPDLLHKSPESTDDIAAPFMELYRRTRRHFCQEILKSRSADSVWEAALRPKWSPCSHNPIGFDERLSKLISRSWNEVRPTVQGAAPYIEADPSLLDVHSGLAHTFDVRRGQVLPERVALFNLRLWISQALHRLWNDRLTGEAAALFRVRSATAELKGLVPRPMLGALSPSHSLPHKYPNPYADRPRHPAPSTG